MVSGGPYCSSLATDGFLLADVHDALDEPRKDDTEFVDPEVQAKFRRFSKFIKGREKNRKFLEAAASLHLRLAEGDGEDEAVRKVADKTPGADEQYVRGVLDELRREKLLPVGSTGGPDVVGGGGIVLGELGEPHAQRYVDKAIHSLLRDVEKNGQVVVVQTRLFRTAEKRPIVDDFMMDETLLDKMLVKVRGNPQNPQT